MFKYKDMHIFIVASFVITKIGRQFKCFFYEVNETQQRYRTCQVEELNYRHT